MAIGRRLRFEILRRDDYTCRYCGRSAPEVALTVDHVVPTTLGGSDDPGNLVSACDECNGGKSSVPADAPVVASVRDDALRWGAAIRAAAEHLLADHDARAEAYSEFDAKWTGWGIGTGDDRMEVPRPDDWRNSVDRFLATGLPLPILLDCIDKAMSTRKLRPENVFRYMAGIAWAKVTEMQRAARGMVTDATPAEGSSSGRVRDFAHKVLTDLLGIQPGDGEYEFAADKARREAEEHGQTFAEEDVDLKVLCVIVAEWQVDIWLFEDAMADLFRVLPKDALRRAQAAAQTDAATHGIGPDDESTASRTSRIVHYLAIEMGLPQNPPSGTDF